jgi:hypothetical protein
MPFDLIPVADLPKTREAALALWDQVRIAGEREGPEAMRHYAALLGRSDLFLLLFGLLRRPDVDHPWIFARTREIQQAPDGYLDLWFRGGYKSTLITFGLTIQNILNDPEISVGIFSHTRPIAKGFLSQIKREFEDNTLLKYVYSDLLWSNPQKEAPRWSEDGGLIVKRKSNPKEASLEAHGLIDGQPTSRHFSLRVYDDVVTRESVTSAEMIAKTTAAWELSLNLGTSGGRVRTIGTRYSLADPYQTMLDRRAVIPRVYAATHNSRMDGRPVFHSEKEWNDMVRVSSRATIASQQLQNPMADSAAIFMAQWLKSYQVRPRTLNVGIMCDPSLGRSATSDNTAFAVIGVASSGAKYLLDGACRRMSLSQRWLTLRGLYRRWSAMKGVQHVSVGFERYSMNSDLEYFQEQMELDHRKRMPGAHFVIEELSWPRDGTRSKIDRVSRLEPDFRNGRFFLPSLVLRDGKEMVWRADDDPASKTFGEIEYFDGIGLTRLQMQAVQGGSTDLISRAIVCRDPGQPGPREGGARYDLTLKFLGEYQFFPFATGHDDLLDACSRIYDLDVHPPIAPSARRSEDPHVYPDGL